MAGKSIGVVKILFNLSFVVGDNDCDNTNLISPTKS